MLCKSEIKDQGNNFVVFIFFFAMLLFCQLFSFVVFNIRGEESNRKMLYRKQGKMSELRFVTTVATGGRVKFVPAV